MLNQSPSPASFVDLAAALNWLVQAPILPGQVLCLGIDWSLWPASTGQQLAAALHDPALAGVSPEERAQAARYVHASDALRHLLARSLLRHLWAAQPHLPAAPPVWPCNPCGKPEGAAWGLHFNLSHAGHHVWLAACRSAPVGIDVETASPAHTDLQHWLHPGETRALQRLYASNNATTGDTGQACSAARRRLWTRKEAIIKAIGLGFSLPLNEFEVDPGSRTSDWLRHPPSGHPGPWTTRDLPLAAASPASPASLSVAVSLAPPAPGPSPGWQFIRRQALLGKVL